MYGITTSGLSITFSFDNNSVNITFNFNQNSTVAKVLLSQLVASHISVFCTPPPTRGNAVKRIYVLYCVRVNEM